MLSHLVFREIQILNIAMGCGSLMVQCVSHAKLTTLSSLVIQLIFHS